MNSRDFVFTREHLDFFRDARERGLSKVEACEELGQWNYMVNRRAREAGLAAELKKIYSPANRKPPSCPWAKDLGMQKVPADQLGGLNVDFSLLHVKAAVMPWRASA